MQNTTLFRWVKASERLPKNKIPVLLNFVGFYGKVYYRDDKWFEEGTNRISTYDSYKQAEWLEEYIPEVQEKSETYSFEEVFNAVKVFSDEEETEDFRKQLTGFLNARKALNELLL